MNKLEYFQRFLCVKQILVNQSVNKPAGEGRELLYAAVAEEGPPAAHILASLHVHIDDLHHFLVLGGTIEELALGTAYEGATPELYAIGLT